MIMTEVFPSRFKFIYFSYIKGVISKTTFTTLLYKVASLVNSEVQNPGSVLSL